MPKCIMVCWVKNGPGNPESEARALDPWIERFFTSSERDMWNGLDNGAQSKNGRANNKSRNRRPLRAICAATALACATLCGSASADEVGHNWGLQAAVGVADHDAKKVDLGVVYDPHWSWWAIGGWHFAFVAEGHVAYWHTSEGNVHDNIGEIGATPVVRFIKDSGSIRPFVEAGVGVRLITHPRIATDYTLSTAFQFADMIGVGAQIGERQQWQVGFRFQHLSNAGIKHPNPGIDFSEIYAQWNF